MNYKAMYKSELAEAAGVSRTTLYRWMRQPEMVRKLRRCGVTPRTKMLPPKAVKLLCEYFVIGQKAQDV